MVARLSRMVPLALILALVAGIVYLVVAYRHSPNRGKEVLIKVFTLITGGLSGFFALACIYTLIERNLFAFDIMASFLAVSAAALATVFVCRAVFLKHHPQYRKKPDKTTTGRRRGR